MLESFTCSKSKFSPPCVHKHLNMGVTRNFINGHILFACLFFWLFFDNYGYFQGEKNSIGKHLTMVFYMLGLSILRSSLNVCGQLQPRSSFTYYTLFFEQYSKERAVWSHKEAWVSGNLIYDFIQSLIKLSGLFSITANRWR